MKDKSKRSASACSPLVMERPYPVSNVWFDICVWYWLSHTDSGTRQEIETIALYLIGHTVLV